MAGTFLTGPSITAGPLFGPPGTLAPQEYGVEFGPSIGYQGDAIPDVRFSVNKDNPVTGSIPGHLNSPYFLMLDAAPAASNTALTVAANAASGTAFGNIAASAAGATINVPFYPFGSSTLVSNAIALDLGWGTLNCASGNAVATPSTGTLGIYYPGQSLVIGSVGNAGATAVLITTVRSVGATTITLSDAPQATNAAAPVGSGNIFTNLFGAPASTGHTPYVAAGLTRLLDPLQSVARGVGVTGVASGTGGNVLIRGYDIYGQPQSEIIAATAGATTAYGKKTYKWFASATPSFSDAHNYTIITSDLFGFSCRSDRWEYTTTFYNGTFQSASGSTSSQWVAGDQTTPATTATLDPKGTFQVSSRGPTAGVTSSTFTDGTKRVAIFMTVPLYNIIAATPQNPVPMYGVTPV